MNLAKKKGQVAMSLVFFIGGIMIIIGATLSFMIVSYFNSTLGFKAANQALSIASSGIDDAVLRLERDNKASSSGYCVPVSCGTNSTTVIITQDSPGAGQITVTSDSRVSGRERKIKAILSVSSSSEVNIISWQILSL